MGTTLGPLADPHDRAPIPDTDLRDAIRLEHGLRTLADEELWRRRQSEARERYKGVGGGVTAIEMGAALSAVSRAVSSSSPPAGQRTEDEANRLRVEEGHRLLLAWERKQEMEDDRWIDPRNAAYALVGFSITFSLVVFGPLAFHLFAVLTGH